VQAAPAPASSASSDCKQPKLPRTASSIRLWTGLRKAPPTTTLPPRNTAPARTARRRSSSHARSARIRKSRSTQAPATPTTPPTLPALRHNPQHFLFAVHLVSGNESESRFSRDGRDAINIHLVVTWAVLHHAHRVPPPHTRNILIHGSICPRQTCRAAYKYREEVRSPRIAFMLNSSVQLRCHHGRFPAIVLEQQHPVARLRMPLPDRSLELPLLCRLLGDFRPIVPLALRDALGA
jgi:hypothetical protein